MGPFRFPLVQPVLCGHVLSFCILLFDECCNVRPLVITLAFLPVRASTHSVTSIFFLLLLPSWNNLSLHSPQYRYLLSLLVSLLHHRKISLSRLMRKSVVQPEGVFACYCDPRSHSLLQLMRNSVVQPHTDFLEGKVQSPLSRRMMTNG